MLLEIRYDFCMCTEFICVQYVLPILSIMLEKDSICAPTMFHVLMDFNAILR